MEKKYKQISGPVILKVSGRNGKKAENVPRHTFTHQEDIDRIF